MELRKSIIITILIPLLLSLFIFTYGQSSWSPKHVYYGKGGKLVYSMDSLGNIIPDFSHVGYRYGDDSIPEIPVKIEISAGEGDDGVTIQNAIDSLARINQDSSGFRGAVLLKKGTYHVSGQLTIATSGIVLRGEGDFVDGTVIIAEGTDRRALILVDNGSERNEATTTSVNIKETYIPVGRKFIVVENTDIFEAGDKIIIHRPGSQEWISDIKMDQITNTEDIVQWSASSYNFSFERTLTRVNGDTLFFRNPVVMAMDSKYGTCSVYKYSFNRMQNIGIENLRLESAYTSDTDEDHSWSAVKLGSVEHSWIRNLTALYFSFACVDLERNSRFITVENSHFREPKSEITGSRRYSFNLDGSMCLIKDCSSIGGRHDFVTGARVCGPNVFLNSEAENTYSDIGPHQRWAMGTLFDNIVTTGAINVQDRDDWGTGHGWAGANQVLWNCSGSSSVCQSPWASAKNYNFGFIGEKLPGRRPDRPDGEWIGHNKPGIFPVSLYDAQLKDRLTQETYFSALPYLDQLNDSTYKMTFTLPINSEQVAEENFVVSGSSKLVDKTFTVFQEDEYSIVFLFSKSVRLEAFSSLIINASMMTSALGRELEGLLESRYIEPDRRPVVSGAAVTVNNEDDYILVSSTKPGHVYMISYGLFPQSKADLDSLVSINKGRKARVEKGGEKVPVYTRGLPGGYYVFFAVDEDERISERGNYLSTVEQTGPLTRIHRFYTSHNLKIYSSKGDLIIDPGQEINYSLKIYTCTGSLLYQQKKLSGMQSLRFPGYEGILIVRKISSAGVLVARSVLYP